MIPFRRILFPVDFSDDCLAMTRRVREMAKQFDAQVILLHAFEPSVIFYGEFAAVDPRWPEQLKRERERLAKFALDEFPGLGTVALVEEGGAAEVIARVAKREMVDLVMMPTTGRGPVKRFLLGSVTAKVLHDVDCPVWTESHEELTAKTEFPHKSILCPVGWTEESAGVLRAASVMARRLGAKLTVLHSVELPPPSLEMDLTPYRAKIAEASREFLMRSQAEAGVEAETVISEAPLSDALRDEAARRGIDLVITGRGHAQGLLSSLWSRLYGIVRHSPCPVLSV
jgi:nucleotide-binding universal stress UspA family protein